MSVSQYQAFLERYVSTLLDIGMGEWDSPVYHGHTTAAYLNLYDFAQSRAVRQLAQTALDWLFFSAALKYWRGTWTVPAKRLGEDHAARFFWLYFGQGPPPERHDNDWIHALTSQYRPPETVLRLAQRDFSQPIEVRRTHPHYENWKPGLYGPAFYETLYLGQTYQLGSLANGSAGDWQGVGLFVAQGNRTDAMTVDSGGTAHQIAQARNLLIWWGETTPEVTLPAGQTETLQGITLVRTEHTWLALRRFPQGFVLEVGEAATHDSYAAFRQDVLTRSRLTRQHDTLIYQGSQGHTLGLHPQPDALPVVWRDGQRHDWRQHTDLTALAALGMTPPAPLPAPRQRRIPVR